MNRTIAPEIEKINNISIFTPKKVMLDNGISVSVVDVEKQGVIRLDMIFKGGRWHQNRNLQALFTSRMLKEGTQSMSSLDISTKLDYYGAYLETSVSLQYSFVTLYSLKKFFPQAISVLSSIIKESVFPNKELDIIKQNNINQFHVNQNNVNFVSNRYFYNSLYGSNHPLGIMIDELDFRNIDSFAVREYYNKIYKSNNCKIFISGNVTQEDISIVNNFFGDSWGNTDNEIADINYSIDTIESNRVFVEKQEAIQSSLRMGYLTINNKSKDFLKLRVLVTLFGGYFGSRLMRNIREDKGYTYGINASLNDYPDSGLISISTECDNRYVEKLIEEVYKEIDLLQSKEVSHSELDKVKNYMLGDFCRGYESAFSIADSCIFLYISELENTYFADSIEAINNITTREIYDLANKYLSKDIMKVCVVGGKNNDYYNEK